MVEKAINHAKLYDNQYIVETIDPERPFVPGLGKPSHQHKWQKNDDAPRNKQSESVSEHMVGGGDDCGQCNADQRQPGVRVSTRIFPRLCFLFRCCCTSCSKLLLGGNHLFVSFLDDTDKCLIPGSFGLSG